jgi:2-keto-4-pentenoate hydratase/2-oxohepta-3-ene-1,7-dioic acid hydratase in catechol pathway
MAALPTSPASSRISPAPRCRPESLAKLQKLDTAKLPRVNAGTRLGPCVGGVGKFIAIGLNYADHAAETGAKIPSEPIVFMKATSCIVGPNDTVRKPRSSTKMDWEVELGVIIGSRASYVSEAEAPSHIAGYCVINDLSERAFQLERGGQWDKGKGCDTFGPLGPLARHLRRDRRPGQSFDVARCERHAPAERLDQDDDLQAGVPRELPEPVHEPAAR